MDLQIIQRFTVDLGFTGDLQIILKIILSRDLLTECIWLTRSQL